MNKERSPFFPTHEGGLATKKGAERMQTQGAAEPLPKSKWTLLNAPTVGSWQERFSPLGPRVPLAQGAARGFRGFGRAVR